MNAITQTYKECIFYGDHYFSIQDYYGAAKYYQKAWNIDSSDLSLAIKLARSYQNYQDYDKAAHIYEKIYKQDRGKNYPDAVFEYAMMLKQTGEYAQAKKMFKRSVRYFRNNKQGYIYQKIMQEQIACDSAMKFMADTLKINVKHAEEPLNTFDAEWAPWIVDPKTWWITSLSATGYTDDGIVKDKNYVARIFPIEKQENSFIRLKAMEITGQPDVHEANAVVSPLKDRIYFSVCDSTGKCRIWMADYRNGQINNPRLLPSSINRTENSATQPFPVLYNGMEVIFFAADYSEGNGKYDIWYCFRTSDGFSSVYHTGDKINSIGNEITPSYDPSKKILYFSSDWHYGLGGFDIFYSQGDIESGFEPPHNIMPPVNSPANDMYYRNFDTMVVWVSNRKGSLSKKGETCCNDVYYFKIDAPKPEQNKEVEAIQKYLPLKLYFHNDEPNPRSRDTITQTDYLTTCRDYYNLKQLYLEKGTEGMDEDEKEQTAIELENFFENYVKNNCDKLERIAGLIYKTLSEGNSIELTVKGFASPLAKSDYNVNLTMRRIHSLINYLEKYHGGVLKPYMYGNASNGARLIIKKIPFGEFKSQKDVSDDEKNVKESIYSIKAALERRIEILSVDELQEENDNAIDKIEIEKDTSENNAFWHIPDTIWVNNYNDTIQIPVYNPANFKINIKKLAPVTDIGMIKWSCHCRYVPPRSTLLYELILSLPQNQTYVPLVIEMEDGLSKKIIIAKKPS